MTQDLHARVRGRRFYEHDLNQALPSIIFPDGAKMLFIVNPNYSKSGKEGDYIVYEYNNFVYKAVRPKHLDFRDPIFNDYFLKNAENMKLVPRINCKDIQQGYLEAGKDQHKLFFHAWEAIESKLPRKLL